MQMHGWRQAARHGQQVAIHMDRIIRYLCGIFIDRRNLDPRNALGAAGDGDRMTMHHPDAGSSGRLCQCAAHLGTQIDKDDFGASGLQRQRCPVGIIIIGEDNGAVAGHHTIAIDIGTDRAGQHHPRQVIAGKDQRAFMRALRQYHLGGAHFPHALAR